jgi:microsomal dipeptidase-like Zn-dependent dipeptidase
LQQFPYLTAELINRGWSEEDVRKVVGLNFIRVLAAAEATALAMQVAGTPTR